MTSPGAILAPFRATLISPVPDQFARSTGIHPIKRIRDKKNMENMEYFGDRAVAKWLHSPLPGELRLKTKFFIRKTIFI